MCTAGEEADWLLGAKLCADTSVFALAWHIPVSGKSAGPNRQVPMSFALLDHLALVGRYRSHMDGSQLALIFTQHRILGQTPVYGLTAHSKDCCQIIVTLHSLLNY